MHEFSVSNKRQKLSPGEKNYGLGLGLIMRATSAMIKLVQQTALYTRTIPGKNKNQREEKDPSIRIDI
jgi:hypothetical protein